MFVLFDVGLFYLMLGYHHASFAVMTRWLSQKPPVAGDHVPIINQSSRSGVRPTNQFWHKTDIGVSEPNMDELMHHYRSFEFELMAFLEQTFSLRHDFAQKPGHRETE